MSRLGRSKKKPIGTEPDLFSLPPIPPIPPPTSSTTKHHSVSGKLTPAGEVPLPSTGSLATGRLLMSGPTSAATTATDSTTAPQPNGAGTSLRLQENSLTTESASAINIQQILGLLHQQAASGQIEPFSTSIQTLRQPLPPSHNLSAGIPFPLDHGWGQHSNASPFSIASTPIELYALLSRVQQQSSMARMLPNPAQHHRPHSQGDHYTRTSINQSRDQATAPTPQTTDSFVEQAARELALRQMLQESSSNRLLLASLWQQQPQNAVTFPTASSLLSGNSQLLSRTDGPLLMESNSTVASDSSMVPNYLRSLIPSRISSVRNNEQLPTVTRPGEDESERGIPGGGGFTQARENKSSGEDGDGSSPGGRKSTSRR
jgi:hypothetical protein